HPSAPAHDVPGAGSEEVLPRHRGEGRLDLRISDPGGRRDLLRIGPPDDLQFALAIHLGRIWLVRRSGQDSTAFECRVLAANRNPVADPMPAETIPLVRTRPDAAAARHGPAHCRRKREGATQFPTIGLFERNANNFKGQPETRRLKNRGHLARNRKFESISLHQRVSCEPDFLSRTAVGTVAENEIGDIACTGILGELCRSGKLTRAEAMTEKGHERPKPSGCTSDR